MRLLIDGEKVVNSLIVKFVEKKVASIALTMCFLAGGVKKTIALTMCPTNSWN